MVAPRPLRPAHVAARRPVRRGEGSYQTAFVGRRAELRSLRALVGPGRVVSLVGPPGVGKSRLAAELAATQERVVEVSVRGVRDADGLTAALAASLEVVRPDVDAAPRALGRVIAARRPGLVWLDACEGLDAGGRAALAAVRAAAPRVPFLVTSQRHLDVPHEHVLAVGPLARADALALLSERVRCARGGRGLDPVEAERADELLDRLDDVPLALELAASRLALLDLDELLGRLEQGLAVIDRGQALSGAVDWAIGLLAPDDRAALAQATRFRGGFELEAAEAVVEIGARPVLDWLAEMVARSLVSVRRGEAGTRYEVFEAVELRAAELLGPREAAEVDARHAAFFAHVAARFEDRELGARRRWMRRERANVEAAEARALDPVVSAELVLAHEVARFGGHGEAADLARLRRAVNGAREVGAAGLLARTLVEEGRFLRLRGHLDEARAPLEEACAIAEAGRGDGLRALTRVERGRLLADAGDAAAVGDLEAGLALADALPRVAADAHVSLGVVAYQGGELERAERSFERAQVLYERAGDRAGRAAAIGNAAAVARSQERFDPARRGFAEAARLHRAEGNLRGEGIACSNLANVERCMGRFDESRAHFAEALRLHRFVGNRRSEALAHCFLGFLELAEGDVTAAARELERARVRGEGAMSPADFALVVDGEVQVAEARGETERARRLRAEAEGLRHRVEPLRVAATGAWFASATERVELDRRQSARRVLEALVALRERSPGDSLSREAMVEAGWPGERILEKAARQRLYVLVNTLRKLGLDALETTEEGWRLDPRVPLCVED
ncbi:MAG: tetratricopeptide repeat protein [Sandaracinaceae bacterium]|nr:tetratricopeptide repeat protein [Sandaracinaceae bacterium]